MQKILGTALFAFSLGAFAADLSADIQQAQTACDGQRKVTRAKVADIPACVQAKELKKQQKEQEKQQKKLQKTAEKEQIKTLKAQAKAERKALNESRKTPAAPGTKRVWNPVLQKYCLHDAYNRMIRCN